MMAEPTMPCKTCRTIRRLSLLFVLVGGLALMVSGTLPVAASDPAAVRGFLIVAIVFVALNLMAKMIGVRRNLQEVLRHTRD